MTRRHSINNPTNPVEPDLTSYGESFRKVILAAYGEDKPVGVVIYAEQGDSRLPMRMVRIYLNGRNENSLRVQTIKEENLRASLANSHKLALNARGGSVLYQRSIRAYEQIYVDGVPVFVVTIIKPDQMRYWIRSSALRDADEVVADLTAWSISSSEVDYQIEVTDG